MREMVGLNAKKNEGKKTKSISRKMRSNFAQSKDSTVENVMFLQRTIGNQAVQRLINSGVLQTKLRIGKPDDIYEQEADRIAEQIMRIPEPQLAKSSAVSNQKLNTRVQRRCPRCIGSQTGKKEEEKFIHTKEVAGSIPEVAPELETSISGIHGGGQHLPESVRAFFEPRFGCDFSKVRVHTDAKAAESALEANALAYTVGQDVVFGTDQYAPSTHSGKKLLAHELAHVVQQSESGISGTLQRLGPAAAAAAGFAAGLVIGALTFEAALDYAKSLSTRYPGWLSTLPNCPCPETEVKSAPGNWESDQNPLLSWFHPGAASSYRSKSTFSSVPGTAHGQQCTYDSGGSLITEGPGAGTPDVWSPTTNKADHMLYDAATWQVLGWRIYNRYWVPNNGNVCPANRGESTLGRRISEFMP